MPDSHQSTKKCGSCGRVFATDAEFLKETSRWRMCNRGNLYFSCSCDSTLVLPNGKFTWFSRTKLMSPEANSLFNQLQKRTQLPYIPHYVFEVQSELANAHASSARLAELIAQDPLLQKETLRIANLVNTNSDSTIESLEHAITFIGHKTLSEIVLIAGIKTFSLKTYSYSAHVFWEESFLTGLIAESLALRFASHIIPHNAFLGGTLANIGKFVGAFYLPKEIDQIHNSLLESTRTKYTWQDAEQKYNAPSHCLLGEIAVAIWGLPPFVSECVTFHHLPDTAMPLSESESLRLVEIAAIANQLSHLLLGRPYRCEKKIIDEASKKIRKSPPLESLLDEFAGFKKAAELINF